MQPAPNHHFDSNTPWQPQGVWQASALSAGGRVAATGHAALDAELPGRGWPLGALTELLQPQAGLFEWRLLLPALRRHPGELALVDPPHAPFAPGLGGQGLDASRLLWVRAGQDGLWATEQLLRCRGVGAVLAWLPQAVRADALRRLQIAAASHQKLLFVFRPAAAARQASPAALRLWVGPAGCAGPLWTAGAEPVGVAVAPGALCVHILKRRGPSLERALTLPAPMGRLGVMLGVCMGAGVAPFVPALPHQADGADALDRLAA